MEPTDPKSTFWFFIGNSTVGIFLERGLKVLKGSREGGSPPLTWPPIILAYWYSGFSVVPSHME